MEDNKPTVKDHKLKIKSVKLSDKPTKNGGKMYHINMEIADMGVELSAVTFSDTIAAEAEKFLDKEVDMKMSEREYNGAKSYTIVELNGVKNSGFGPRGKNYQVDQVGLERRAAAEYTTQLFVAQSPKAINMKDWIKTAEHIYEWISARPVKPENKDKEPISLKPEDYPE